MKSDEKQNFINHELAGGSYQNRIVHAHNPPHIRNINSIDTVHSYSREGGDGQKDLLQISTIFLSYLIVKEKYDEVFGRFSTAIKYSLFKWTFIFIYFIAVSMIHKEYGEDRSVDFHE